jgi:hypothetical protein
MGEVDLNAVVKVQGQGALTPDFEVIEASGLPGIASRWCVWRAERKGERLCKVPSNGRVNLDGNNLEQWLTYADAKEAYLSGGWDGVGLMPLLSDGLVGLDLDKVLYVTGVCKGGGVADLVLGMERIGCYMERSPSGTGLRGFVVGVKPADCKAKVTVDGHSVECYQREGDRKDNYLTVTGRLWGGVDVGREAMQVSVEGSQDALVEFLDSVGLLESTAYSETKAVLSKVGRKATSEGYDGEWVRRPDKAVLALLKRLDRDGIYQRLMDGDAGHYAGESEARFALLSQLAYITRDDEQIERIARMSKLDASRFDEKRSGFRNRLHYDVMNALKEKDRNFDADQAGKAQDAEHRADAVKALKAKGALLHGGFDSLLSTTGKFIPGSHTLSELLLRDKRLLGVVYYDEFAEMPMKAVPFSEAFNDPCAPKTSGKLEDDDLLAITAWVRKQWGFVAEDRPTQTGGLRRWARMTSVNPVTTKLQKFADDWDGVERLGSWLVKYMGCSVPNKEREYYLCEVGKRFLVGVVARAFVPGTQQDQMLVLESADGGEGKTAAVRILGKTIDESAFLEGFNPTDDKDCFMKLRGKILAEWGEMAGFDRRESGWNKSFVTLAEDSYRDPYGTFVQAWKRTVSFVATTNSDDYLKETGGMRRYWPVKVGFVDLVGLQRDMGQLWGEAVRLYQAGFQFWVDKTAVRDARFRSLCEAEQRGRLVVTAHDDKVKGLSYGIVAGVVAMPSESKRCGERAEATDTFSVSDIGSMLYGSQYNPGGAEWKREWVAMAAALKRCGWVNAKLPGNQRAWRMSEDLVKRMRQLVNEDGPQPTHEMLANFSKMA